MEDGPVDWDSERYSSGGNNGDKVGCVLRDGLRLGKKILITGILVCSAPVALPPILALSAVAFTLSVPYGVFLASYVCTEKLMGKLLPRPTPYQLGYEALTNEDEDDMGFMGHIGQVKDEEELVEEREQLREWNASDVGSYPPRSFANEEVEAFGVKDVKLNGVEREPAKYLDGGWEKPLGVPVEVTTVVLEESGGIDKASDIKEREELVNETTGLLERIRDGDKSIAGVQKENQETKDVDTTRYANDIHRELKEISETEGKLKSKSEESDTGSGTPISRISGQKDVGGQRKKERKSASEKARMLDGGQKGANIENNVVLQPNEREIAVSSDAPVEDVATREAVDKTNRADQLDKSAYKAYEVPVELPVAAQVHKVEDSQDSTEKDSGDLVNHVDLPGKHESEVAVISHDPIPLSEVIFDEKEIWEKLDAVRKIVGQKAAPLSTCVEELKALYIVTGVEPPSSFKDPSDLVELNAKLRFLMAVVGVK